MVLVVSTLLEDFHRNDPNCELNQISQVQCEFYAILISDSNETIEILEAIYMTWFTIEFLVRFISCPDRFVITTTDVGFALNFAEKEIEGIWKIHFFPLDTRPRREFHYI